MSIELDGFAVLKSIGNHPNDFTTIKGDVIKAAHDLVVKQLKAKAITLGEIRVVRSTLGTEQFSLVLDGMKDASVTSILKRLEKHHPDLKSSDERWRRGRLRSLFEGRAEPVEKPAPQKARARASTPPGGRSKKPPRQTETIEVVRDLFKTK